MWTAELKTNFTFNLVLRTANGTPVTSAEFVRLTALKPLTDFCRGVLVAVSLLFAVVVQVMAQPEHSAQHKVREGVRMTLEADRQIMGVADRLRLTLSVEAPTDITVTLPETTDMLGPFRVQSQTPTGPLPHTPQTQQWRQDYILEADAAGEQTIPALTISFRRQDAAEDVASQPLSTDPMTINVISILPDDADVAAPKDIAPPVTLLRRGLPTWVWIVAAGLAGLGIAMLIGWWYRQRQRSRIVAVPPQPAHVFALQALQRLEQQNLIGQRQIEPFYVQLSAILRHYIEWRFRLRAPEQTTEEFLAAAMTSGGLIATHRDALRAFLQHCDLVKFARHEPTSDDMQRTFDSAKTFVNQTADDEVMVPANAVGAEV